MTKGMDWLKKHADTVVIMAGVLTATLWMHSALYNLEKDLGNRISALSDRVYAIEKDLAVIKAILVVKGYIPSDFAATPRE